jgi:hypothetical protein
MSVHDATIVNVALQDRASARRGPPVPRGGLQRGGRDRGPRRSSVVRVHDPAAAPLPGGAGRVAAARGAAHDAQGIGAAIGMNVGGRLTDRLGAGRVVPAGLLVLAVGTIPYAFIGSDTGYAVLLAGLFVRGVGLGATLMPSMAAAYATLERAEVPRATPMLNVVQRVGGSVGVAVLTVSLQNRIASNSAAGSPIRSGCVRARLCPVAGRDRRGARAGAAAADARGAARAPGGGRGRGGFGPCGRGATDGGGRLSARRPGSQNSPTAEASRRGAPVAANMPDPGRRSSAGRALHS